MTRLALATLAAVTIAAAVSSCTSAATSRPAASSPPAALPAATSPAPASPGSTGAGYQPIGGAVQGVSVDVPSSWRTVDFSQLTVQQAFSQLALPGVSESQFAAELQPLANSRGVMAVDTSADVQTHDGDFAPTVNAYCTSSGTTQSGSAGVSFLRQATQSTLTQELATITSQTDTQVGGVPGLENVYDSSPAPGVIVYAAQLAALPAAGRACYVTLSAPGDLPSVALAEAISTVQFP
jgi:hypothetical protein